jgi:hypothetical protein
MLGRDLMRKNCVFYFEINVQNPIDCMNRESQCVIATFMLVKGLVAAQSMHIGQ